MPHLADGTLRRLCDEPGSDADRAHLAACAACSARQTRLAGAAAAVHGLLTDGATSPGDIASAHAVVLARSLASPAAARPRVTVPVRTQRFSAGMAALAAAAVLVLAFTLTPLRGLATSFLAVFEPKEIVALPISRTDMQQLRALPDLSSFGTMRHVTHTGTITNATTPAQAAALAGMPVAVPEAVPPGATNVIYAIHGRTEATFTFNAAKARAAAAAAGKRMPAMPPRIDGSTLVVSLGPVVISGYGEPNQHPATARHDTMPKLFVAQAPVPRVGSTGASAREIEAYLLAQPGVPPRLAAEIAAIGDPASTLPIPIPIEKAYSTPVTVHGQHGLAIGDNTGLGSGVVWEQGGMIYAVGGPLSMGDALRYANSLQIVSAAPVQPLLRSVVPRRVNVH